MWLSFQRMSLKSITLPTVCLTAKTYIQEIPFREFFFDAAAVMDEYVTRYAQVQVDRLNVRPGASTEENRIGYIDKGEKVKVLEDCGEWLRVQYTDQKEGYVCAEYVNVLEEYIYAKTLEEERAEMAKKESREERKNVSVLHHVNL